MKTSSSIKPMITKREQQVLQLIAYERSSHEIAEELFVSYETAQSHRKNLLKKLRVRNTAGMVRVAFETGLLRLGQAVMMICIMTMFTNIAQAANTIEVMNSMDSGSGSLREAVSIAQSGDSIIFNISTDGMAIKLTSGHIFINNKDLIIKGNGIGQTIIDGSMDDTDRLLRINDSEVHLEGISFINGGSASFSNFGGAIVMNGTHNTTIDNCYFAGNVAATSGSVLRSVTGTLKVTNSVFEQNINAASGSIINLDSNGPMDSVLFSQCLFINQTMNEQLISVGTTVQVEVIHSTIIQNSGKACIRGSGQSIVKNTIFKGSTPAELNFGGGTTTSENNLVETLGQMPSTGNTVDVAIFVDEANGDYRLLPCSPGIDSGVLLANSPSFDFEGDARVNGTVDIGYDEYAGAEITVVTCGASVSGNINISLPQGTAPQCGGSADGNFGGVWYSFSGSDQQIRVTVDADPDSNSNTDLDDSQLAVYSGSCGMFTCIVANDDSTPPGGLGSSVIFSADAGTDYYFYVDGFGSLVGNFELSVECILEGDICDTAIPADFINDSGTGCGSPTTLPFSTNGATDSGQNGGCDSAQYGYDRWFSWTATTDHLNWIPQAGNPGISIWSDCSNHITCKPSPSTNTLPLTGWNIGDQLLIQIYGIESAGNADVSFCLEDACVNTGTAGSTEVCNNSTALIDLFDLLTGADAGGEWTETGSMMSTGGAFVATAGTFGPMGQLPGTYTFTYTDLNCGSSTSLDIVVFEFNAAGDADVISYHPVGSMQNIPLFSLLQNADPGGTWSSVSQPPPAGFSVDANGDAFFDTDGAALGRYSFRYAQTNTSPCPNQTREVTIQITPINDFICDAEVLAVQPLGSDPECNGLNPYTLAYSSFEDDEEASDCSTSPCGLPTTAGLKSDKKCFSGNLRSVWFQFTAPTSGQVNISLDHPQTDLVNEFVSLSLWEESVPDFQEQPKKRRGSSLCYINIEYTQEVACSRGNGWESCGTAIMNQGLTSGKTYYIKVEAYFSRADFCLTVSEVDIPAHIDFNQAIPLAVSADGTCSTVTSGTTRGSANTNSVGTYYQLENTSATEKFYQVSYIHQGLAKELPTLVFDGDFKNAFFPYHNTLDLAANTTSTEVFIPFDTRIFNIDFSLILSVTFIETDFDICVVECSPAPNYSSNSALSISLSDDSCNNSVTGTTDCAPDGALYYTFSAPATANYTFSSAGSAITVGQQTNRDELVASLSQGSSHTIKILPSEVFQLLGEPLSIAKPGAFSLCVRSCVDSSPPNDLCQDAIPLVMTTPDPVEQTCYNANIFTISSVISVCEDFSYGCATDSGVADPTFDGGLSGSHGYNPGFDQWYSVTVPESGELTIEIDNISGLFSSPVFAYELYEGSCGNLTSVGHSGQGPFWDNLPAGITLYIRLWQVETNVGTHATLCISSGGFLVDNCPPELNLSGTNAGISDMSTRENIGMINSDQRLQQTAEVIYNAGAEINLSAGFEVEAGASFHAYIEGCTSTIGF